MKNHQLQLEEKRKKKTQIDDKEILNYYIGKSNNKTRIKQEKDKKIYEIESELRKMNLSRNEARVYIFLAKNGAKKAQQITEHLEIHRTETYNILKKLESQGLVSRILKRPMKFIATSFENVLTTHINERKQKIHQLEQRKIELLQIWKSLPENNNLINKKETFQVLEGKSHISVRLSEIIENTNNQIELIVSDSNLLWLFNTPILDNIYKMTLRKEIRVRLLTNYSPTSNYVIEGINMQNGDFAYTKKNEMPGFLISDNNEMILLMSNDQSNLTGMWTNYETIVKSYFILFNLLWKDST
jgi:sugar-specific transcriptional regulator TrmB